MDYHGTFPSFVHANHKLLLLLAVSSASLPSTLLCFFYHITLSDLLTLHFPSFSSALVAGYKPLHPHHHLHFFQCSASWLFIARICCSASGLMSWSFLL
jgi:hypothetical protein